MDSDSANPSAPEEQGASGSGDSSPESTGRSASDDGGDPLVGTLLDNRYRIIERLASGGMGVVYRGERVELERVVAIKFLHVGLLANRESMKRFKREAMTMSKLTHPNCVSVIDIGVSGEAPYIVMDFVTGQTLEDVIEAEGRLPAGRAVYLVKQVLAALAHAHGKELVHRDIKPANVMLSSAEGTADHVFVLDFGLAKFSNMRDNNITGASTVLGTPVYMSPEQTRGQKVGPGSDIYSAGIMLFELLTGEPPYAAENPLETLYAHQGAPIPTLAERVPGVHFSPELEHVINSALAKNPDRRFESAAAFATALDEVPEAVSYTPPRLASPRSKSGRAAGKRVRINERMAFASTQPVNTLDLEIKAQQRTSGSQQSGGRRAPSSAATVAMKNPSQAPILGRGSGPVPQPSQATQVLSGPAITGPITGTGRITGGQYQSQESPAAAPAASLSAANLDAKKPVGNRPRWLVPAIIGAVAIIGIVVALLSMSSGDGDEPNAKAAHPEIDAGVIDAPPTVAIITDAAVAADAGPEKIVVKHVKDVEKLIRQKRVDEALAGIKKLLASTHKKNAYLWMLQGNMYFEKRYYTRGLDSYKKSLSKKRKYRSFATVNKNLIEALSIDKLLTKTNRMYLKIIKRDGLKYLKRAKVEHRSTKVRRRASWLYDQIARKRR